MESLYKQNLVGVAQYDFLQKSTDTAVESETNHLQFEIPKQHIENIKDKYSNEDVITSDYNLTNGCNMNKINGKQAIQTYMIIDKIKTTRLWSNEDEDSNEIEKSEVLFEPSGKHITSVRSSTAPGVSSKFCFNKKSSVYVCNGKFCKIVKLYLSNFLQNCKAVFILELREKPVPECNSRCVISHMESPSEFYIQLIDEENIHIDS